MNGRESSFSLTQKRRLLSLLIVPCLEVKEVAACAAAPHMYLQCRMANMW